MLAGCASGVNDPPAVSSNPAHADCKVAYDRAFVAAQGDTDAQAAKKRYWDCLGDNGDVYTARSPPPMDRHTGAQ